MFDVSKEDITDGSIPRALAFLATPILAQQLVLVGQQVVDIFWVGRLGEDPVAAIGLLAPVLGFLHVGTYVAYTGGQVVVSQRVGADDADGANRAAFQSLLVVLAVTLVASLSVVGLASVFLDDVAPNAAVAEYAFAYLVVIALGQVFPAMSDVFEGGFYGWGDSKTPLYINVFAILLNVVLDPFLIFGWWEFPRLGVQGAALATVLAYAAGFLVALGIALSGRHDLTLDREAVAFDPAVAREVLSVGLPKAGQEVARQFARLLLVAVVTVAGGAAGLAAYIVGARIATLAFVPAAAVGAAATSLVGQNLGAEKPDRATRVTWTAVAGGGLLVGVLVGGVQFAFPETIALAFVPDLSAAGLELTVAYLQILALGYWALGAIKTVEAGFNGASRTTVSMVATMLQYWGVRVPVAAGLTFLAGYGALGVFWAVTLSNVVAAVGLCAYFCYSARGGMLERAAERAGGSTPAD
ncbi:MATE family efflux transporter [Halobium salinum]|uniref:Multidrug-efflux transporter n=1 Tax=Halobium salinum TaxID=1364940 RepID=A0ABD5PFP1_9EURY|nr:MATE family efflux transporter [Halobium salinum]